MIDLNLTMGGQSVTTAASFDVMNPSTGDLAGRAPNATSEDLETAVAAAKTAFESWSTKPDEELQVACQLVAQTIGEHSEELPGLSPQNRENR